MNEQFEVRAPKALRSTRLVAIWLPILFCLIEAGVVFSLLGNPLGDLESVPIVTVYLLAAILPHLLLAFAARSRSPLLFIGSLIMTILAAIVDVGAFVIFDGCREFLEVVFIKASEILVAFAVLAILLGINRIKASKS
jgi:hypothetical protein